MKVVQVGKYYPPVPGGIENNVCALCEGLARHIDVEALVFGTERTTRREIRNGVPVVRVGTWGKLWSTEIAPGFFKHMARVDADIVHLHMPSPVSELSYLVAQWRNERLKPRLVVTYHADLPWRVFPLYEPLILKVLRSADRIVCYTEKYWKSSRILRNFDEKKAIIPHGLPFDHYRASDEIQHKADEIRKKYGRGIVLFVGRLVYYKGLPELIQAMRQVDGTLLIAGAGPMETLVRELIGQYGLQSKVKLLGRVDEQTKIALYHACDVFTLPAINRAEAYGQVILEAQACRKPVVSTSLDSGVSELNQHGCTGQTVTPGNADELAGALSTLLTDFETADRFGEYAQQRVKREFTRERMVELMLDLYHDVLNKNRNHSPRSRVEMGA